MVKLRTVYMLGDPAHPGSRKAVITFSIQDLVSKGDKLLESKTAQHKFKLLAGQRWDPDTDSIKISCDDFPTFNMNAKWCSDVLDKLIAEARVSACLFACCQLEETACIHTDLPRCISLPSGHIRYHGGYPTGYQTRRCSQGKEASPESDNQ